MESIKKSIRVIDEHGKEYLPAYPRRARGLVKKVVLIGLEKT